MNNVSLSDIIRIQNADISGVLCMEQSDAVYMKESAIMKLAEESRVSENSIEELAQHITRSTYDREDYCLIRDKNIPGLFVESYVPNISEDYDSILTKFAVLEACNDIILNETNVSEEMAIVAVGKFLNMFKKGDYTDAPVIKHRLSLCEKEISRIEFEINELKKDDKLAKDIKKIYSLKSIISGLGNLGITAGIGFLLGGGVSAITITLSILNTARISYDYINYEKILKRYLKGLYAAKDYLKDASATKGNVTNTPSNKKNNIRPKAVAEV